MDDRLVRTVSWLHAACIAPCPSQCSCLQPQLPTMLLKMSTGHYCDGVVAYHMLLVEYAAQAAIFIVTIDWLKV